MEQKLPTDSKMWKVFDLKDFFSLENPKVRTSVEFSWILNAVQRRQFGFCGYWLAYQSWMNICYYQYDIVGECNERWRIRWINGMVKWYAAEQKIVPQLWCCNSVLAFKFYTVRYIPWRNGQYLIKKCKILFIKHHLNMSKCKDFFIIDIR